MALSLPTQNGTRYRVYLTPLVSQYVYGTEVEITDRVTFNGLNEIKRAIDSQNYEVGVYYYSDVELIAANDNGYFNDPTDLRSVFTFNRDRAKVRIVFENTSGDAIVFYGLVNEEATRIDALNDVVTFRVLSRDSCIRNTQVSGGTVASGVTIKTAIQAILANAVISSVLTVSSVNVNPNLNFVIDLGDVFDGMPTQDALNLLLLASNSVMTIDASGNLIVKSRAAISTTAILSLYGPFEMQRRQNVVNIQNYNTGLQRMFTSVAATDGNGAVTVFDNVALATTYGYRQLSVEFPFITNASTLATVARNLLAEFSSPKVELEVEVPTSIARTVDLLDRVSIDWPLRITPYGSNMMPVIGTATIGNASLPLPNKSGSLSISPNVAFKVIEINESPNAFTSVLKLRQIGTTLSDGYFNIPSSSLIGFAVIGQSTIGGTGITADSYNPSALGAALVGSTKIA